MTCTTAHQLIQEALDMPGLAQPALEAHLAGCGACRSYAEGMRRLARDLAVQEGAPAVLMDRLGLANPRTRQAGRRWMPLGIVAAGLLVVMGLGPRLQGLAPSAEPSAAVVAEVPGESILDYFDPGEPAEADPFALL